VPREILLSTPPVERDPEVPVRARGSAAAGNSISVVVCTYNRAAKLPVTLKSLLGMNVPAGVEWEVVCVDNNSTDDTPNVIEAFGRESTVPVRYVFEPLQGLAAARNAGLGAARGDIIAMTDDDCIVDPGWLAEICAEFASDPELGILGGRVELFNPEDLPLTVRTGRDRFAVTWDTLFSGIAGCNMAFRRTVVSAVGPFDPEFGAGAKLKSAEDVDFIYRVLRSGIKAIYVPTVLLYHDHGRRTEDDRAKLFGDYIFGRGAFYMKHVLSNDRIVQKMAYWESINLLREALAAGLGVRKFDAAGWNPLGLLWFGMLCGLRARLGRKRPRTGQ
jgi:glycosyltransferase involved in cell wall biosynthesis